MLNFGGCGGLERADFWQCSLSEIVVFLNDFGQYLYLEDVVVMKGLMLKQLSLWEDLVVLKGLIFDILLLVGYGGLKRTCLQ